MFKIVAVSVWNSEPLADRTVCQECDLAQLTVSDCLTVFDIAGGSALRVRGMKWDC